MIPSIPLLSGEEMSLEAVRANVWVYSYDVATRAIVPCLVAGTTEREGDGIVVVLDDETEMLLLKDEMILGREGEYVRGNDLVAGQSLMPLYRKQSNGYEIVLQPWMRLWDRTHQMSYRGYHGKYILDGHDIHHIDHNKRNNVPTNLIQMSASDHVKHHLQVRWTSEEARDAAAERMRQENDARVSEGRMEAIAAKISDGLNAHYKFLWENGDAERSKEIYRAYMAGETVRSICKRTGLDFGGLYMRFAKLGALTKKQAGIPKTMSQDSKSRIAEKLRENAKRIREDETQRLAMSRKRSIMRKAAWDRDLEKHSDEVDALYAAYNAGETLVSIRRRTGKNIGVMLGQFKRRGLPLKKELKAMHNHRIAAVRNAGTIRVTRLVAPVGNYAFGGVFVASGKAA